MVSRGGFGLWLDADLYHGSSFSCPTFRNASLSTQEDFIVQDLEVWTVHNWGRKSGNSLLKNTTIPVELRCTNDWVTSVQNLQICYNLAIVQAEIGSQVEEVVGAELSVRAGSVCGWSGRAASNFSWFCWYKTLAVHKQASAELSKALAS